MAHPKNAFGRWQALDALLTALPDCDDLFMWGKTKQGGFATDGRAYDMRDWDSRKANPDKSQIHIHGSWVARCLGWSMQTFKNTVEALHDHGYYLPLKGSATPHLYSFNLKDAAGGPEPTGLFTDCLLYTSPSPRD